MTGATNRYFLWFFLCIFMLMLSGCAAKRFARIAAKYEQAEMYQLAVDNYCLSLQKKSEKNDDARIGLMRSSKRYADELEYKINDAYTFLNDELVVKYFLELMALQEKTANFKVDLNISFKTQGQFEESKTRHLRVTYTKAQELLDMEKFQEAELFFAEVLKIDPAYERAAELYNFSRCEPLYRNGRQNMQAKLYRSAYYEFEKLLAIDVQFKDAITLQKEALQEALLTIAIKQLVNGERYPYLAQQIEYATMGEFGKSTHPFLKIVSLDYTAEMLAGQKYALQNNLSFDAGLIIPVRVYLTGNIINAQYTVSKRIPTERKAYLRYTDKNKEVSYKKVYYFEYEQRANASFRFNYEFINVQNATVLASDRMEKHYSDQVKYADSEYDLKHLFPADWGDGRIDTMYTDYNRVSAMKQLFDARSTLVDRKSYENAFAVEAATAMLKKISAYDPEK
jgi:hypothetical protein